MPLVDGRVRSAGDLHGLHGLLSGEWVPFDGVPLVGEKTVLRKDWKGASWVGVRDHSWGMGRTGGKNAGVAPEGGKDPRRGFAMRQWTMFKMPDRVMFWQFHQQPDGSVRIPEALQPYLGRAELR